MATYTRRNQKSGTRWVAVIRTIQVPYLSKTFRTKDAARIWARRMENDVDLARAEANPVMRSMTLADLADDYILNGWKGKDPSRPAKVSWWVEQLGSTRLRDLDRGKVQAALERYKAGKARRWDGIDSNGKVRTAETARGRSGATVNRTRAALEAVLKHGRQRHGVDINPLANVPRERESKGRTRFLSEVELQRLLAACDASRWDRLRLLVVTAIGTGARLGELMGLRWSDIDFQARVAHLADTKNGSDRLLTLPPAVIAELMRFRQIGDSLLFPGKRFPNKPFEFRKHWDRALIEAGIDDFVFHSLRHSCASFLAKSGASLPEIGAVLGHKSVQSTNRYAHLAIDRQQQLTDRVFGDILKAK